MTGKNCKLKYKAKRLENANKTKQVFFSFFYTELIIYLFLNLCN